MKNGIAIASLVALVLLLGYLLVNSLVNNKRVTAISQEYEKLYKECMSAVKTVDTIVDTFYVSVPKPYRVVDSVYVVTKCDSLFNRVYKDSLTYEDLVLNYDIQVLGELDELGFGYRITRHPETTIIYKDRIIEKECIEKPNIYALAAFSNKGFGLGCALSYDKWLGSYTFSSNIMHTVTIGYKVN